MAQPEPSNIQLVRDLIELQDRVSAVRNDVKAAELATAIEDETAYLLDNAAQALYAAYRSVGDASRHIAARVGFNAAMPEVADAASG